MFKNIIKRDGRVVPFDPEKNHKSYNKGRQSNRRV